MSPRRAWLPAGKTLVTFEFKVLPELRKWVCEDPTAPHGAAALKRLPPTTGATAAPT